MRKLFTAGLLIVSLGVAHAQDKIEGIGIFKVGKLTVSEFEQYAATNGLPITKVSNSEENYRNRNAPIRELLVSSPTSYENPPYSSFCPKTRAFSLNTYTVAGIDVNNLILTFYEGKLIRLVCSSPGQELVDAVKLKYGPSVDTTEKRKSACPSGKDDMTYHNTWKNGDIEAAYTLSSYLNGDCTPKVLHFFHVESKASTGIEYRCAETGKAQFTKSEGAKRKESLKDF